MAISYLIKIEGTTLPKLKEFKVGRNKLWADADRNMSGELRATFIGIFPKLFLGFAPTTSAELSTILDLLDRPNFTVDWYDEENDKITEGEFYAGDFEYPIIDKDKGLYNAFSVNLIPFKPLAQMSV